MGLAILLRTIVLTPWLAGLFWRGTADVAAAVLAVALVALWVVPLLRDQAQARRVATGDLRLRGVGAS
ncbi:hypothetical protein [Actinoplanes sp. M2I2]|uniref:hypothetical protein n=1 Tax=Actinoplanes sp. M2I2 TaxID=1734444 RepID=UPI0020214EDD|nr:hypothetical protein [Actinoplanes sp. M2I2]